MTINRFRLSHRWSWGVGGDGGWEGGGGGGGWYYIPRKYVAVITYPYPIRNVCLAKLCYLDKLRGGFLFTDNREILNTGSVTITRIAIMTLNSLSPGRCGCGFKYSILKSILQIDILNIAAGIILRWITEYYMIILYDIHRFW